MSESRIIIDNMDDQIQVEPNHYDFTYDHKKRFTSYWHQIKEIMELEPKNMLEIGVGSNFLANYLENKNINITTTDIDKNLNPDVVGDILKLPFEEDSFEVITAFEVLEHLPFSNFLKALREMRRVTNSHLILSIPDRSKYIKLYFKFPYFWRYEKLIDFNGKYISSLGTKAAKESDEHYWEIGIKNYPLDRIVKKIKCLNLSIEKNYRNVKHPTHRFFVLSLDD